MPARPGIVDGVAFLILPSPLLPASAYERLAEALRRLDAGATVASAALGEGETASDLVERWAMSVGAQTVLVPHSNAGYLAPSVRAVRKGSMPILFMDAALPPAEGPTTLAQPGFRGFLAGRASDSGLLPPWTQWWPPQDLATVVPDADLAALDRDCPRLQLTYFDFSFVAPPAWGRAANAYLAFGGTYGEELDRGAASGWPHARLEGAHLHFLHDPDAVAAALIGLERDLRSRGTDQESL